VCLVCRQKRVLRCGASLRDSVGAGLMAQAERVHASTELEMEDSDGAA